MKEIRNRLALLPFTLSLIAGLAIPVTAQTGTSTTTTTTTATCTTAPTSITTLSLESVLTLSDVLTTLTPNIPSNLLASIAGGAQEIRSRLIYNPQQNTLTNTVFLVAAGSPNPTPLSTNVGPATILSFVINVSQIYTSCKPTPSVLMVGTIKLRPERSVWRFHGRSGGRILRIHHRHYASDQQRCRSGSRSGRCLFRRFDGRIFHLPGRSCYAARLRHWQPHHRSESRATNFRLGAGLCQPVLHRCIRVYRSEQAAVDV